MQRHGQGGEADGGAASRKICSSETGVLGMVSKGAAAQRGLGYGAARVAKWRLDSTTSMKLGSLRTMRSVSAQMWRRQSHFQGWRRAARSRTRA
jgi:hypothetical protein